MKLVLSCEHGGNSIPKTYATLFNNPSVLNSHRGYDLGALDLFNHLKPLATYSKYSETSRLLIELNRSLHHKHLFSEFTNTLRANEKKKIITNHYIIYRSSIEQQIKKLLNKNTVVLHLSVHSFTPVYNTVQRNCDIGILYDPSKSNEKHLALKLKTLLKAFNSELNVRFNYPYLGKADGFTTYLRKKTNKNYMGIEIEVNQKFSNKNIMSLPIKEALYTTVNQLLRSI